MTGTILVRDEDNTPELGDLYIADEEINSISANGILFRNGDKAL
jgi:hypothetical protein